MEFPSGSDLRNDTSPSSIEPEESFSTCDDAVPAQDIESEYGWKLYFGELEETTNGNNQDIDLEYGWRLYFGELESQPTTKPSTENEQQQSRGEVVLAEQGSDEIGSVLSDNAVRTSFYAVEKGAGVDSGDAIDEHNADERDEVWEDSPEFCQLEEHQPPTASPLNLRNGAQRHQTFVRLKQVDFTCEFDVHSEMLGKT